MSDCRAVDKLHDDEWPKQWQEAHGSPNCCARFRNRRFPRLVLKISIETDSNLLLQIHITTDTNPLQICVDAIVNCGPREDSTRIGSAGTVRRQAVDVSPLRRVNQAIALLTVGTREASFRNVKSIAECLAEELINAAKGSSNSYAIKKKDELERVAKSNR